MADDADGDVPDNYSPITVTLSEKDFETHDVGDGGYAVYVNRVPMKTVLRAIEGSRGQAVPIGALTVAGPNGIGFAFNASVQSSRMEMTVTNDATDGPTVYLSGPARRTAQVYSDGNNTNKSELRFELGSLAGDDDAPADALLESVSVNEGRDDDANASDDEGAAPVDPYLIAEGGFMPSYRLPWREWARAAEIMRYEAAHSQQFADPAAVVSVDEVPGKFMKVNVTCSIFGPLSTAVCLALRMVGDSKYTVRAVTTQDTSRLDPTLLCESSTGVHSTAIPGLDIAGLERVDAAALRQRSERHARYAEAGPLNNAALNDGSGAGVYIQVYARYTEPYPHVKAYCAHFLPQGKCNNLAGCLPADLMKTVHASRGTFYLSFIFDAEAKNPVCSVLSAGVVPPLGVPPIHELNMFEADALSDRPPSTPSLMSVEVHIPPENRDRFKQLVRKYDSADSLPVPALQMSLRTQSGTNTLACTAAFHEYVREEVARLAREGEAASKARRAARAEKLRAEKAKRESRMNDALARKREAEERAAARARRAKDTPMLVLTVDLFGEPWPAERSAFTFKFNQSDDVIASMSEGTYDKFVEEAMMAQQAARDSPMEDALVAMGSGSGKEQRDAVRAMREQRAKQVGRNTVLTQEQLGRLHDAMVGNLAPFLVRNAPPVVGDDADDGSLDDGECAPPADDEAFWKEGPCCYSEVGDALDRVMVAATTSHEETCAIVGARNRHRQKRRAAHSAARRRSSSSSSSAGSDDGGADSDGSSASNRTSSSTRSLATSDMCSTDDASYRSGSESD